MSQKFGKLGDLGITKTRDQRIGKPANKTNLANGDTKGNLEEVVLGNQRNIAKITN